MDRDLEVWEGGITKDVFDKAKNKGTHYQIINHKLYREKDCMFPFRYDFWGFVNYKIFQLP